MNMLFFCLRQKRSMPPRGGGGQQTIRGSMPVEKISAVISALKSKFD